MTDSLQPDESYSPWTSLGQNTEVALSLLQGNLPNPEIKPRSSALQMDSLPAEPQGSPFILVVLENEVMIGKKKIVMCTHSDLPFF